MEKTCQQCNGAMNLPRSDAKFCSNACKMRHYRAEKRKRNAVPQVMRDCDQWIRWKAEKRGNGLSKAPRRVNGRGYASSTDSATWSDYDTAYESTHGDGLGFVLNGNGLAVIDLDDCLIDGAPTPAAQRVLDMFPSAWVEISPSGNGLHIWGNAPAQKGSGQKTTADGLKVEFYTQGRYMTVTGNVFRRGDLLERLSVDGFK